MLMTVDEVRELELDGAARCECGGPLRLSVFATDDYFGLLAECPMFPQHERVVWRRLRDEPMEVGGGN